MNTYGTEQTIRVADLVEGDWIEVIPTQDGVRGIKLNSGVQALFEGYGWVAGRGRGRARVDLDSTRIVTRRGNVHVPSHFSVVVRREVSA